MAARLLETFASACIPGTKESSAPSHATGFRPFYRNMPRMALNGD